MKALIEARKKIDKAIGMLLVKGHGKYKNCPSIFGYIAIQLPHHPTDDIETAAVRLLGNGKIELIYNPEFINPLSNAQVRYVVIHEMTHIINDHLTRMETRNPLLWNVATDWTVNYDIEKYFANEYITKPSEDILLPDEEALEFVDHHTVSELFYEYLKKNTEDKLQTSWSQDHQFDNEEEFSSIVGTAAKAYGRNLISSAAKLAGDECPGYLKQRLKKITHHKLNWKRFLRAFINAFIIVDYKSSWVKPNRRFQPVIKDGKIFPIYPGYLPVRTSRLGIIVDVSGSVSCEELSQFFGEIKAISDITESEVVQIDTQIRDIKPIKLNEFRHKEINIEIKGGGGTDLNPALKYFTEKRDIDGIVIFTDGYLYKEPLSTRKRELWIISESGTIKIPGFKSQDRNATIIRIEK